MTYEPFICDECGKPGRRAPGTGWCVMCEQEYQIGIANARDALVFPGALDAGDYAVIEDIDNELRQ